MASNDCELCGDPVPVADRHRITASQAEPMGMDTGTIVHRQCYLDSRPSVLRRKERKL